MNYPDNVIEQPTAQPVEQPAAQLVEQPTVSPHLPEQPTPDNPSAPAAPTRAALISDGFTAPLFRDDPESTPAADGAQEPAQRDLLAAFQHGMATAYTDPSQAFQERLRLLNDTQAAVKAERARLHALGGQVRALLRALPYLDTSVPDGRYMADNVLSIDTAFQSRAYVNLRMYRLGGFKDPRLTDVLSAMLESGWTCQPTHTNAESETIYRMFSFRFDPQPGSKGAMPLPGGGTWRPRTHRGHRDALPMALVICAAVQADEGTCQRVQVGEERKEIVRPIYEVICS